MSDSHRLSSVEGLDLPPETLRILTSTGVPTALRLPDWLGPSLFDSEIGGERLISSTDRDAAVPRGGPRAGYEIGTVRETQGFPSVLAVFVLQPTSGEVWLRDAGEDVDRYVNSSLSAFLAAIEGFRVAWPRLVSDTDERDEFLEGFRELLVRLDPGSLSDPESYWPGWLEELA